MKVSTLVIMIAFGFIVAEIAKAKGYVRQSGEPKTKKPTKYTYIGWWFCGALLFIVSFIWVLALPNLNKQQNQQAQQLKPAQPYNPQIQQTQPNMTEELQKYKDLYDSGLITKEEYEKKKAQILKI